MAPQDTIILTERGSEPSPESDPKKVMISSRFDGIVIGLGALGLVAILYLIATGIPPFLIIAVVFLLLYPFKEYSAARVMMFVTGILLCFWLAASLSDLMFPFIMGLLIAYLFNPVVKWLQRQWKIPRTLSAIVIVLVLCSLVGFIGWLTAPHIVNEAERLLHTVSNVFQDKTFLIDEVALRRFFVSLGIPGNYVTTYLNEQIYPAIKQYAAELPKIAVSIVSALPAVVQRIADLIIIPISAIYFLKDWDAMVQSLLSLVPPKRRPHLKVTLSNINTIVYGYIRGQSTVAIIIGILAGITFALFGVPYASLLGVTIAFFDLIPFIGIIASIVIVELVIFISMPATPANMLFGVAVIIGLHLIEAYLLGPRIVGKGIGIPPLLVIISIFVFGYFLGFIGMLIAVPLTGVILLFVREYRQAIASGPLGETL